MIAADGKLLLAAVNPAAAEAGLAPGMPLADARSFLPGLATAPAEPAADRVALTRLAEWCGRYSPWTAPDGSDGVKLEITGCAHLWGGEAALAADLARRLARQGIVHRIAVAGTYGAAWALARYAPTGQACGQKAHAEVRATLLPAAAERDALAPLPVEALRLDAAIAQGLRRVGLKPIGELYPMPRDALARRFGEAVALRLDQAEGRRPEPLSPLGEAPTRRVRLSFAEPIADPADLARAAGRLTGDLVRWLARDGVGARRLDLGFHRVDGRVERIRLGTARPSRDPAHLAKLFVARLDTVDPGEGIEDMILAAYAVETLAAEQIDNPIFDPAQSPSARTGEGSGAGLAQGGMAPPVAALIDRLAARLGPDAIGRLEARESHIPERASGMVAIGDTSDKKGGRLGRAQMPTSPSRALPGPLPLPPTSGEGLKPPRPVRLFTPPEPIEAVWLLPDDPPLQFAWRRRRHRIAQADGPERVAEEWWRPPAGAWLPADDAVRDYYRVEDAEGRRFWLFRAGFPGGERPVRWYVHGVFA